MAGISNTEKIEKATDLCEIVFNGGIHTDVRAALVNELVKYFLYERQQIPSPFDHLIKTKEETKSEDETQTGTTSSLIHKKRRLFEDRKDKKCTCLMSSLKELMHQVESAFEACPELCQVLVTLGGTVVSPKESFLINLPPLTPEADAIPQKTSVKTLFRQIISSDILGGAKSISPTNMSLMIFAPRDSGIEWFVPKPTFKAPSRGRQFVYNFVCRYSLKEPHDLSYVGGSVDISGIEPLDPDSDEDDVGCKSRDLCSTSSCSSLVSNSTAVSSDSETTEADIIWFQAPLVVKGYQEKL